MEYKERNREKNTAVLEYQFSMEKWNPLFKKLI